VTSHSRLEYEQRVNRVIDHVREHLADPLSLAGLARVAAFSPFHFHRVFRAITGETLFGFIQRQRLEKAAGALRRAGGPSILAVALDHGFTSAATFARAFRAHFRMSATEWRAGGAARWRARGHGRNPGKQLRKSRKAPRSARTDTHRTHRKEGTMSIQVRDLPAYHVAYMRYVGPYGPHGIPALWNRLLIWMEPRGLGTPPPIRLGVAYDDPAITAAAQCRYDACVVVPPDFVGDRWVNVTDVRAGRYAVATFAGTAAEIGSAWDRMFGAWLPGSGYAPDDRPCYEIYRGEPQASAKTRSFRCELCLPVRPL
jgi:AraC family transcriptional regulator